MKIEIYDAKPGKLPVLVSLSPDDKAARLSLDFARMASDERVNVYLDIPRHSIDDVASMLESAAKGLRAVVTS